MPSITVQAPDQLAIGYWLSAIGFRMLQPSLFHDTPTRIRRAAVAGVILVALGIVGYRVAAALAPPPLDLDQPSDRLTTVSRTVTIRGRTVPGASVAINGRALTPDPRGAFVTDVVLLPGENTIAIEARRRHGWTARVERRIYVRAADAPLARGPKL